MPINIAEEMSLFHQVYKEENEIYRSYAKGQGVSETTLWVLYSLYLRKNAYSQKELCDDWFYTPQTVNSVLKSLEQQGIVRLAFSPGNRKNKRILLTESGRTLAKRLIAPLLQAETNAFFALTREERDAMLKGMQKQNRLLKQEINNISRSSEDGSPQ